MNRCVAFLVVVFGIRGVLEAAPPNILVLLADDLGWTDLSCYGGKHIGTPNLDRLAHEGMRFTDFYAAAPNCSPSRAGLLTGRIPSRTGVYSYIPPRGPHFLPRSEVTIAELLRDRGYDTAHVGKWHLCHDLLSEVLPQPKDHGFNYSFSTVNNASPNHLDPRNFVRDGKAVPRTKGYSCEIVASEVIHWLKNVRAKERPFFVCAWFHETHTPLASPPELVARHAGTVSRKEALYNANVENLDRATGRLLGALDEMQLTDDTFVVFSSDNGGVNRRSNGPLRGRKSFVWEGGIREPGIMRWPGRIEPGSVCRQPAGLVDLLPTFCAMAGCSPPSDRPIDGVNLLPLFEGRSIERHRPLFWYFYRTSPAAAMRDGDWVLVGYLGGDLPKSHALTAAQMKYLKKARLERFELFNVRDDIAQERDRSSEDPSRFARMKADMIAIHAAVIAGGPVWEFEDGRAR